MVIFAEVWRSRDVEAVVATTALLSRSLLIGYNRTGLELPMVLPEGTGVPRRPSRTRRVSTSHRSSTRSRWATTTRPPSTRTELRASASASPRSSGEEVALDGSRDSLAPTIVACQVFDVFVAIAAAAGVELTTESFAAVSALPHPRDAC